MKGTRLQTIDAAQTHVSTPGKPSAGLHTFSMHTPTPHRQYAHKWLNDKVLPAEGRSDVAQLLYTSL
jgi:hypothetical protein